MADPLPPSPAGPRPVGDPEAAGAPPGTRDRLIRAAIDIVATEGVAALTTVEVCRRVGIAQSSYYSHFATRDELLQALAEVIATHSNIPNRSVRAEFAARRDAESLREVFRVPLEMAGANPELFRLTISARDEPEGSALGAHARRLADANRREIADHLMALGDVDDPALRRRHEMAADCVNAMISTLALGHLEGRYPDLDEAVDLLALWARWPPALRAWLGWDQEAEG